MRAEWYLSREGRADGPHSQEAVESLLSRGEILFSDMGFLVGDTRWRKLSEFREFESSDAHRWIVLRNQKRDSNQIPVPEGPYRRTEIVDLLEKGEINRKDHIWREGLSAWMSIEHADVFRDSLNEEYVHSEFSAREFKASVEPAPTVIELGPSILNEPQEEAELVAQLMEQHDFVDVEEKTEILPQGSFLVTDSHGQVAYEEPSIPTMEEAETQIIYEPTQIAPPSKKQSRRRKIQRFAVGAFAASFLFLFLAQNFSTRDTKNSGRTIASQEGGEVSATPFIRMVPLKLAGDQPQIAFETNAAVGENLQIELRAISGQVLRVIQLSRQDNLKRSNGELPLLQLSKWDLPAGQYELVARYRESEDKKLLFLGRDDQAFREALARHQKSLAFAHLMEKYRLIQMANRLYVAAKSPQATTRQNFIQSVKNDLEKVLQTPTDQMFHRDQFEAILSAVESIQSGGNRSVASVQTSQVEDLIQKFQNITADARP